MSLNLQGIPQLFKHSKEVKTGTGNVRTGQASIIVGKESGSDFDDIQEAINSVNNTGALIYIKAGTYEITELNLKSNITLEGEGEHTIIDITAGTNDYGKLDLSSTDGVSIKNMTIKLRGDVSGSVAWYSIKLDSVTDLNIENVNFENYVDNEGSSDVGFFRATTGTSTLRLINCEFSNKESGSAYNIFLNTAMTNSLIVGNSESGNMELLGDTGNGGDITLNRFIGNSCKGFSILGQTGQNIDNNIFLGNKFYYLEFGDEGTCNNNVISSNYLTGGAGSRIYLGTNSNYNSVTGNVHDATNYNNGTGNIFSGDVQY